MSHCYEILGLYEFCLNRSNPQLQNFWTKYAYSTPPQVLTGEVSQIEGLNNRPCVSVKSKLALFMLTTWQLAPGSDYWIDYWIDLLVDMDMFVWMARQLTASRSWLVVIVVKPQKIHQCKKLHSTYQFTFMPGKMVFGSSPT